jgi:hypothetical protein
MSFPNFGPDGNLTKTSAVLRPNPMHEKLRTSSEFRIYHQEHELINKKDCDLINLPQKTKIDRDYTNGIKRIY